MTHNQDEGMAMNDKNELLRRAGQVIAWTCFGDCRFGAGVVPESSLVLEEIKQALEEPATTQAPSDVLEAACAIYAEPSRWPEDFGAGAQQIRRDKMAKVLSLVAAPVQSTAAGERAPSDAVRDVLAERQRQISDEGWTPEHDDEHDKGEIAVAAALYALRRKADPVLWVTSGSRPGWAANFLEDVEAWVKPCDPRRSLVKAGALILSELERLDRASPTPPQASSTEGGV